MQHQVISGSVSPDAFKATLRLPARPNEQYCFQVEAKLDGGWYWSVCACHNASFCASGRSASRVEALAAAEDRLDWMAKALPLTAPG